MSKEDYETKIEVELPPHSEPPSSRGLMIGVAITFAVIALLIGFEIAYQAK